MPHGQDALCIGVHKSRISTHELISLLHARRAGRRALIGYNVKCDLLDSNDCDTGKYLFQKLRALSCPSNAGVSKDDGV